MSTESPDFYEVYEAVETMREEKVSFSTEPEELKHSLSLDEKRNLFRLWTKGEISRCSASFMLDGAIKRLERENWSDFGMSGELGDFSFDIEIF
jgi:hypothetical protein